MRSLKQRNTEVKILVKCPNCGLDFNNSNGASKLVQGRTGYILFCECGFIGYVKIIGIFEKNKEQK